MRDLEACFGYAGDFEDFFETLDHAYLKKQEEILENDSSDESRKAVSMGILNTFYVRNYDRTRDFYEQFYERLEETEAVL